MCSLEAASDTLLRDHVRMLDVEYAARQRDAGKYACTPVMAYNHDGLWKLQKSALTRRDMCAQRPRSTTTTSTKVSNELLLNPCPINTFVNGLACVQGGAACCSTTHQLFNNLTKQNPDPRT